MKQLKSSIPHVTLVGNVNSGKSTIFNDLVNQEVAVVSDVAGTTTDLVYKRMELLDFGPIQLVDTPGINDSSELGHLRIKNTKKAIKESDL
nr:50S ribosome-binding GTPase [Mycoplasmatales bacterium]